MSLYLNVPYEEKDEIKALGGKWDLKVKKWYVETSYDKYIKFSKWLLRDDEEAYIATEYIFLIEAEQKCWKCDKLTKVVALGIGEYVYIYGGVDSPEFDIVQDYVDIGEELHIAWVDKEEQIPLKLLKYLKKKYSVKTTFSKTLNEYCFANHCDFCGALQGNWFLFNEMNSPFSVYGSESEIIEKIGRLKIKAIPIDDDLHLHWNIYHSSEDNIYLKYGKFEELILSSDPNNDYITYEELYC